MSPAYWFLLGCFCIVWALALLAMREASRNHARFMHVCDGVLRSKDINSPAWRAMSQALDEKFRRRGDVPEGFGA